MRRRTVSLPISSAASGSTPQRSVVTPESRRSLQHEDECGCITISLAGRWPESTPVQDIDYSEGIGDFFHAPGSKGVYTQGLRWASGGRSSPSGHSTDERWRCGRGITSAEAVNRVLQWGSLARDGVLPAWYKRQRVLHYLSC